MQPFSNLSCYSYNVKSFVQYEHSKISRIKGTQILDTMQLIGSKIEMFERERSSSLELILKVRASSNSGISAGYYNLIQTLLVWYAELKIVFKIY